MDTIPLGSQLVEEIGMKFQRLPPCFLGPATQWKYTECCATKPEVGNRRWRPPKPEVLISQLVDEIETKFQRLHPCFRGSVIQWKYYECCLTKPEVRNPTIKPPSWTSDFRFGRTAFRLFALTYWTPKNMGLAFGISFLSHLQAEILGGGWQPPPPQ